MRLGHVPRVELSKQNIAIAPFFMEYKNGLYILLVTKNLQKSFIGSSVNEESV